MIDITPGWGAIIGGILFHQWADFSWAIVFFVLLGRWTAHLSPRAILFVALPRAILTSSREWLLLVPLVPFWQPIFPLEQIYWVGLAVHMSSASIYPIFPALGVGHQGDTRIFSMIHRLVGHCDRALVNVDATSGRDGEIGRHPSHR